MDIDVASHGASLDALPRGLVVLRPAVIVQVFEARRRGWVEHDRHVGVELDGASRHRRGHRTFDRSGDSVGLAIAKREEHEVTSAQDRSEALVTQ